VFTRYNEILMFQRRWDFCHWLCGARFHTIHTGNTTLRSPQWQAGNASRN